MNLSAIVDEIKALGEKPHPSVTATDLNNSGLKNIELHDYQVTGVAWLIRCAKNGHGAILADEMGLGKTCQTIATLTYLKVHTPSLVIAPLSVIRNWETELRSFSDLTFTTYMGTKEEREARQKEIKSIPHLNVLLTTYELCINDEEFLRTFAWSSIVVDEAHRLKNIKSLLHDVISQFKSKQVFLLTGTPVQNNLNELYSLLNIVAPKIFRKRYNEDFVQYFSNIKSEDSEEIKELRQILKHFLLRRTKDEVLLNLPHKIEVVLFHGITELQKKYYKAILLKDLDVFSSTSVQKTKLLNILMQLRKCVNHPYLFDGVEPEPFEMGEHLMEASGKLLLVDHLLAFLKPLGHKVLLFSQMTRMLDILQDYLTYRDYSYERLDGSVRGEERFLAVKNFNDKRDTFVFLLSTRAGGQGLNLVAADTVIFVDSDFNPQNDIQAAARAHRIGQSRPVRIIRLIGKNTVDEIILRRAEEKLTLTERILEGGQYSDVNRDKTASFAKNAEEIRDILKFGLHELMGSTSAHENVKSINLESILGGTTESNEWIPLKMDATTETRETLKLEDENEKTEDEVNSLTGNVNHMYIFEGRDYSKDTSRHDEAALESLKKEQEELTDASEELVGTEGMRRQKKTEFFCIGLPPSKPRRVLTEAEKAEAHRKREERRTKKQKEEEEKELELAQHRKRRQGELWRKYNYESSAILLEGESDEESEDVTHVEEDEETNVDEDSPRVKQIHYTKGDVSFPHVRGGGDAIICHAVDDSGKWGAGGVFSAIHARSEKPEEQYELAGKVGDLALGDVHLVPCDDIRVRSDGHDYVALLVCQHRDRHNRLSGLKLVPLEECLKKVRQAALKLKASVHLPRMGHNTPNFNWYGVEKLIRKCLVLHGISSTVYYYKRNDKTEQPITKRKIESSSSPEEGKVKRARLSEGKKGSHSAHAVSDTDPSSNDDEINMAETNNHSSAPLKEKPYRKAIHNISDSDSHGEQDEEDIKGPSCPNEEDSE